MADRPTLSVIAQLIDNLSGPLRSTAETVKSVSEGIKGALEAIGVGLSLAALGEFFKAAVEKAGEAEQAISFLRQAVNNAGESFGQWQPKIDSTIEGLEQVTTFGKTEFTQALTNMVAKSNDVQGSIGNMGLAADIAAKKHISLAEAGDLVGKAMDGNTKVFKDFGIQTGTTADKMDQLRVKTQGYAEADLNTLGGRIRQAKTAFDEFEESVGGVITGSDGAKDAAGFFATALGELKGWVDDNKDSLEKFVGGIINTITVVGNLLAPIVDLGVAIYHGIDAVVGWSNIWKGFQVVLVNVGAVFGTIAAGAEYMVGYLLDRFGNLVAQSGPLFKLLGINVTTWSQSVIQSGRDMETHATDSFKSIDAKTSASVKAIVDGTDSSQKAMTATVKDQAGQRTNVLTTEQQKQLDAQQKALKGAQDSMATFTAGFVKDFAGTMPAAAADVTNKIAAITKEIEKNQASADKATGTIKEGFEKAVTEGENMRATYEQVLPVFSKLADLSKAVTATESDTNPRERLNELNAELAQANALRADTLGNSAAQADLDKQIAAIQKDITQATKDSAVAGLDVNDLAAAGKEDDRIRESYAAAQEKHAQAVRDAMKETVNQAISLATQTGLIDQQTSSVLTSAIGIGQALASGDMVGAVAGFGGLLSSLFGASPENAARKALLDKNNERLSELSAINGKLVDASDSGTKIQEVLNALNGTNVSVTAGTGIRQLNSGDVAGRLIQNGGSFQDVVDVAKSLGIDLGNTNQQTSEALLTLRTALQNLKPQAFGSDFQGQLDQATFQESLTGGQLSLGDYKDVIGGAGSPVLAQLFDGLDLNDPKDLAVLGQRIQALGSSANSLTNAQVGNLSRGQVTSTLSALAGLLPQGTTTGATTSAVTGAASLIATPTVSVSTAGFDFPGMQDAITSRQDAQTALLSAIEDHTNVMADVLTGGGLVTLMTTGTQQQVNLTSVNAGTI
jgi:hypothetical protein